MATKPNSKGILGKNNLWPPFYKCFEFVHQIFWHFQANNAHPFSLWEFKNGDCQILSKRNVTTSWMGWACLKYFSRSEGNVSTMESSIDSDSEEGNRSGENEGKASSDKKELNFLAFSSERSNAHPFSLWEFSECYW